MSVVRSRFAMAVAFALPIAWSGALGAQGFAYVPGTSIYRMVVKSTGTSEAQGGKRDLGLDADERLTLTISGLARDTLALSVVLDSAAIRSSALGPVDASSAVGLTVRALISPTGRVYSRELPALVGREAFAQVAEEMARFLPALPESLHVGLTWRDSLAEPVAQLGILVTRTRVTNYRVAGDTTFAGRSDAWRIERRTRTTMSGSGSSMGTPVVFEGSSAGTGAYYVSRAGRYLGAELKEEVRSRVTLATLGQEVLGNQTQTASITLVR